MNACLKMVFLGALAGVGGLLGAPVPADARQSPPEFPPKGSVPKDVPKDMPKDIPKDMKEMIHIEGWFVSAEKDQTGKFSHCQMMNPYFHGESAIILSLTLSPEHKALVMVIDPHAGRLKPATPPKTGGEAGGKAANAATARQGTYAFDGQADKTVPAAFSGTLGRLEIPDWASFRRQLVTAKRLKIAGPDRDRTFNLYGVPDAVGVLETCVMDRGLPAPTPGTKPGETAIPPQNNSPKSQPVPAQNQAGPAKSQPVPTQSQPVPGSGAPQGGAPSTWKILD